MLHSSQSKPITCHFNTPQCSKSYRPALMRLLLCLQPPPYGLPHKRKACLNLLQAAILILLPRKTYLMASNTRPSSLPGDVVSSIATNSNKCTALPQPPPQTTLRPQPKLQPWMPKEEPLKTELPRQGGGLLGRGLPSRSSAQRGVPRMVSRYFEKCRIHIKQIGSNGCKKRKA